MLIIIYTKKSYSKYWILQHIKKSLKLLKFWGNKLLISYQEKLDFYVFFSYKKNELHWIMFFFKIIKLSQLLIKFIISKLFQFQSKDDSFIFVLYQSSIIREQNLKKFEVNKLMHIVMEKTNKCNYTCIRIVISYLCNFQITDKLISINFDQTETIVLDYYCILNI